MKHKGGFFSKQRAVNCILNTDNRQFIKFKPLWYRHLEEIVTTLLCFALIFGGMLIMLKLAEAQLK